MRTRRAVSVVLAGVGPAAQAPAASSPADALKRLQWRNIGPTAQTGRTPVFVGLPDSEKIARIVMDPKNADVAYACALGRE